MPRAGSKNRFWPRSAGVSAITEPATIQIWGAFAFSESYGNTYGAVQKGYLYYTCPKGSERVCLNEWADLKAMAGKDEPVGFGDRYRDKTTKLRKATEKPASPDPYPLNVGVVAMGKYAGVTYPELTKALRDAIKIK